MKKIELSLNDIVNINIKLKNGMLKRNLTKEDYEFFNKKYKTSESITKLDIALEQNYISIDTKNKEIVISSISDKYIKERVCDKYGNIANIYYIA